MSRRLTHAALMGRTVTGPAVALIERYLGGTHGLGGHIVKGDVALVERYPGRTHGLGSHIVESGVALLDWHWGSEDHGRREDCNDLSRMHASSGRWVSSLRNFCRGLVGRYWLISVGESRRDGCH
jgi:hypothetical protein